MKAFEDLYASKREGIPRINKESVFPLYAFLLGRGDDPCKAWLLVDWPLVFQGANYSRSLGRRELLYCVSVRKLKVHVKIQNILQTSEKKD